MYFYIILVHNYTTLPQRPSFTSQNSLFDRSWNHKRARCRLHRLDIWAVDKLVISQSFIGGNWRSTWVYKPPNDFFLEIRPYWKGGNPSTKVY